MFPDIVWKQSHKWHHVALIRCCNRSSLNATGNFSRLRDGLLACLIDCLPSRRRLAAFLLYLSYLLLVPLLHRYFVTFCYFLTAAWCCLLPICVCFPLCRFVLMCACLLIRVGLGGSCEQRLELDYHVTWSDVFLHVIYPQWHPLELDIYSNDIIVYRNWSCFCMSCKIGTTQPAERDKRLDSPLNCPLLLKVPPEGWLQILVLSLKSYCESATAGMLRAQFAKCVLD